jgi:ABC-2 type transport system permease protein
LVALLAIGLVFGWQQVSSTSRERAAGQARAVEQWQNQGEKNPHAAAHYGMWVFKPTGALAAFDSGVSEHLGVALKLEAHRQNLPEHAAASDSVASQRMGSLSPATVLALLGPLWVIALGFGAWTLERERGTLRMLASLGVRARTLFLGKALALFGASGTLLAAAGALCMAALVALPGASGSEAARLATNLGVHAIYFGIFVGLSLAVSASARESRAALVGLVGFWGLTCVVVPRVAAEWAAHRFPIPSPTEFASAVAHSLEKGLPGAPPRDERIEELTVSMLEETGYAGAENLMDESLLAGIELQAEATFEDEVFDHHVGALLDAYAAQEAGWRQAAVLSPFVALRAASMALSGTDFAHHRAFSAAAEDYRKQLVRSLNEAFAQQAGAQGWSYKAGAELWAKAAPFVHVPPSFSWALQGSLPSVLVLLGWLGAACGLALWAASRVRVVVG